MNLVTAYAVTFIASFCTLVIEIVAGRILAPYVGVSLYTWTSIIGVVLAGISIGAYVGGRIADRFPRRKTLGLLLLISGFAALSIAPLTNLFGPLSFNMPLMWRILLITTLIFFIPSCILGTISPVVVRLAIQDLEKVGHVVGKIYAFSTLGSIIGTFMAGFFLISWMGTRNIILLMGVILIITAVVLGALFKSTKPAIAFLALPLVLLWGTYDIAFKPDLAANTYHYKESDYYTIKVNKTVGSDKETRFEALILDNLIHSFVNLRDPLHIEYRYEKIYAEVLKWRYARDGDFKSLTIGGGGYTFPRYMEIYYPNSQIDVVEIDPEVTKIVYSHLGLPKDTRIRTFNTDGRWFVMNCKEKYDLLFADAYNDLSIPYHLTTKEFAQLMKGIMNPGAILLTNIIDNFQRGSFLPSYIRTLREVFGDENVHILSVSPQFEKIGISTFIVLASNGHLNIKDFEAYVNNSFGGQAASAVVPESLVDEFLKKRRSIVITDDHAPVDNLIAPNFEERFGYNRKNR
ncbi:MAG TPA: fused MFS/spermidine synthase [Dissulfurispiraceae bacterium]|nr:fused MFS/spermidine synthase [Dissulfurispiraceae bacterium]